MRFTTDSGNTLHSDPSQIPTVDEKAALAGSYGTPDANNAYVTEDDPRRNMVVTDVSSFPYNVQVTDRFLALTGAGDINLPTAANYGNGTLIIEGGSGAVTIYGTPSPTTYNAPALVYFGSNGANWYSGDYFGHKTQHANGEGDEITPASIDAAHIDDLSNHTSNTSNPHSVTVAQIGAAPSNEGVLNGNSHNHIGGDGAAITEGALTLSDVTTNDANSSTHGFVPKAPANAEQFLNGNAAWSVPVGYVPVGGIIAWHKSLTGCPALPSAFVECNGQTLSDADSPFNGQVIPDLNGEGRFLRGSNVSGTNQANENLSHTHPMSGSGDANIHNIPDYVAANGNFTIATPTGGTTWEFKYAIDANGGNESRPDNMSVVWVMRIK